MNLQRYINIGTIAVALIAANPGISASNPNSTGFPAQMVITVLPSHDGSRPQSLERGDLTVLQGKMRAPVTGLQRLTGNAADMQLFILLDDSTRGSSLGTQLPELKTFIESLPATTQVAIGYMQNGGFGLQQAFTADHGAAAKAVRLPASIPGENGSPYFVLSDLAKHWPSKQATGRRAVLMFTDGVDRYYGASDMNDPYVEAAIHDTLKNGITVYSVYLRGAGLYGRSNWVTTFAQSRLLEVSQETGGYAYFEGLTNPVSISPFLKDFQDRFENQYRVTIAASEKGFQTVKLMTESPGLKIDAPTRIYVQ